MNEDVKDRIVLLVERDSVAAQSTDLLPPISELTNAQVTGCTSRPLPPEHVLEIYNKRKPVLEASGNLLGGLDELLAALANETADVIIVQLSSNERSFVFFLTEDQQRLVGYVAMNHQQA